jgi:hypothetical protein
MTNGWTTYNPYKSYLEIFSSSLHLYGGENKFIKARSAPLKLIGFILYICNNTTDDLLVSLEQSSLTAYLKQYF